jgi:hypothetical protein
MVSRPAALDAGGFGGEVAGDDQHLGNEVGIRLALQHGFPAFQGDLPRVVLHRLGPVVHQVLVDVVGVDQARTTESFEQALGNGLD